MATEFSSVFILHPHLLLNQWLCNVHTWNKEEKCSFCLGNLLVMITWRVSKFQRKRKEKRPLSGSFYPSFSWSSVWTSCWWGELSNERDEESSSFFHVFFTFFSLFDVLCVCDYFWQLLPQLKKALHFFCWAFLPKISSSFGTRREYRFLAPFFPANPCHRYILSSARNNMANR